MNHQTFQVSSIMFLEPSYLLFSTTFYSTWPSYIVILPSMSRSLAFGGRSGLSQKDPIKVQTLSKIIACPWTSRSEVNHIWQLFLLESIMNKKLISSPVFCCDKNNFILVSLVFFLWKTEVFVKRNKFYSKTFYWNILDILTIS